MDEIQRRFFFVLNQVFREIGNLQFCVAIWHVNCYIKIVVRVWLVVVSSRCK